MKTRLTIDYIDISPLTKPQDSKMYNGFIKAKLKETCWIMYTQFNVLPDDDPAIVTNKIMLAMLKLMDYINHPYDAPCENPYTGTNEVSTWYEELERCGIKPEVKEIKEVKVEAQEASQGGN